jgi:hypothetical protein
LSAGALSAPGLVYRALGVARLRVPRDAIGWTFGLPPGTYQPVDMS